QQWGAGGGVGGYAALSLYKTADVDGDFLFETYSAGGTADAPKIQFGRLWDASLLVLDVPNWRVAIGSTHPATSTLLVAGGASGAVFGTNDWDETAHTGSGLWVFQGANTGNTYSALDSWGSGGTVATNLALAPFSANLLVGTTSDNSTGAKLQVSGTATLSNSGGVSANNLFLNNDYGSASDLVESNIIFGGRAFGRRWGRIGGQQSMPGTYAWGQLNFYTYSGDVPHTSPDMTLDGYGDLYLNTGRLIANNGVVGTLLLQADKPATDAPSTWPSGASVRRIYGNGYPYDFGHLLTIRGGTSNPVTQLAIAWPGTTAGPSGLWVRGARDNTDVWGPWLQMVGNDGGTYSINVTGNAGYATTALNSAQYATSGSWDTDFLNTLPGQRRWTQIASGVNAPATGWFFAENIRYGDGGNYWGRQLAWGWYDRPGKVFTRDINGGTFGAWMQIPTVAAMSGSDGLGGRIRAADLGCNSWYTDSCDANGDGILDHAAVADSAYQWIGTRQVSFVYGGDPNVVIPATTVDNIWRPESASAATVTKVWCATDAGTVTLSMLRNDHGPAFASGTCGTTGSYLTVTANGYHYIPNAGPGDPNWYGLSFQTSSVSGVHNLSVTVAYTPAY
ncbi:MAG: hypothetical protein M1541_14805, partial [Acidobacteria bacterium]|nr:hypothetical protein [Acidobacteriota bacterium]